MKTIRYKTIAVLSLMLLIAGLYCQPPSVPALESESLNSDVPSESLNSDADAKGPCPPAYIKLVSPRSAKVGDTISIQGWRFGDKEGSVVFPNGVNADVTLWRQQRIEVTVPEGAQTGNISVTTSCGSDNKKGAGSYFKVMEKQPQN